MMTPIKTGRETAEEKFAAAQKKTKKAIADKEQAQIVRARPYCWVARAPLGETSRREKSCRRSRR